jgi:hypothetical protein
MLVKLTQDVKENGGLKTTARPGRATVVWRAGTVIEMSDATAAKYVAAGTAAPLTAEERAAEDRRRRRLAEDERRREEDRRLGEAARAVEEKRLARAAADRDIADTVAMDHEGGDEEESL